MKTYSIALAVAILGTSLSSAFAEPANPNAALVPAAVATRVIAAPVVEGRQTAPIATLAVTDAERIIIDRNGPSVH